MSRLYYWATVCVAVALFTCSQNVFSAENTDLISLKNEIAEMRKLYEQKIQLLEKKVTSLQSQQEELKKQEPAAQVARAPATSQRSIGSNDFNPSISAILQGKYNSFSKRNSEFSGFAVGEEGERSSEGFTLDETEINLAASIDDKFRGSSTIALVQEDGTQVELEEAYIETIGLPFGISAKAGRFFASLGYLNEHHSHADDFTDRPLPYRVFLNKSYNDDGVQATWIAPTDLYTELGFGVFRGGDFPGGGEGDSNVGAWTVFARIGGDMGDNSAWRMGLSTLQVDDLERSSNEDELEFAGDNKMYIVDGRYIWAPTGNNREKELILQAEYMQRDEDGIYDDLAAGSGPVSYDEDQSGWYAQGIYKFHPQWRVGARYSHLNPGDVPTALVGTVLDDQNHDPESLSLMADWTNSEFGRLRLQYNMEELADDNRDHQITLQYIMSMGAHAAHSF
ncbi:MAG: hypothetical protein GKR92_03615 [Gammaproteobacteria bacterium]|nr:MAG: hypothetical protein GKR92_03615 [Gammaproteobacteria bacterium]